MSRLQGKCSRSKETQNGNTWDRPEQKDLTVKEGVQRRKGRYPSPRDGDVPGGRHNRVVPTHIRPERE